MKHLENEFMKLSVDCYKQAAAHAYDATQPHWDKIDAISDRLVRVEQISEETKADVNVLKRQMTVVAVRLDRIDGEIGRLDRRIDGLSGRVDDLSGRVDTLSGRVDDLTGRVDTLSEQVTTLTGRFDTLTVHVSDLTDRVDAMAASNMRMFELVLDRLGALQHDTHQPQRVAGVELSQG
ncbi:hypothetical protein B1L11_16900 [Microbispora sp. GKU 823]|nr:hypothetical protein B1L11_16900 [Microbispora sp. GKU 823]